MKTHFFAKTVVFSILFLLAAGCGSGKHKKHTTPSFTITAAAGAHGSISPSGQVSVPAGGNITFNFLPDTDYGVESVTVDGSPVVLSASYTFTSVDAVHSINVSFYRVVFHISASAGANGSISPSGTTDVSLSDSATFTFTPDTGYEVDEVLVDGSSSGSPSSYTFSNVCADHSISATFKVKYYTITASAGANGAITPSGTVSVAYGDSREFIIEAASGYAITDITVDGSSVGRFPIYEFDNVCADHTIAATFSAAGADTAVAGTLEIGLATAKCIGPRWEIGGDSDGDAVVEVYYRLSGNTEWKRGFDFRRVQRAYMSSSLLPPSGYILHAGSIVDLQPDTLYDVRVVLNDPDGGGAVRETSVRTWDEPFQVSPTRTIHVSPGSGGGSGTAADPYLGIAEADSHAQPGDLIILHAGTYTGSTTLTASGSQGNPIVWRAATGETAVLDGGGGSPIIQMTDLHDVFFEDLEMFNANHAFSVFGCKRIVFRGLYIHDVYYGIDTSTAGCERFWISDCIIEGPYTWSQAGGGVSERRGIMVAGEGHVICHNRISGMKDAIDTASPAPTRDIDIYLNDISVCTDDGMELDYSDCNTRAFDNRLSNCYQGISFQPIKGGPSYAFRNALYNIKVEPFKLHKTGSETSGAVLLHNTIVSYDQPCFVSTTDTLHNALYLNNLFVSRASNYALCLEVPIDDVVMDYDVVAGGPYGNFGKWGVGVGANRYANIAAFFAGPSNEGGPGTGNEEHGVYQSSFDNIFAAGTAPPVSQSTEYPVSTNDLRPSGTNPAVDAGCVIPNFNDGYAGSSPDSGCLEYGKSLPAYGPR